MENSPPGIQTITAGAAPHRPRRELHRRRIFRGILRRCASRAGQQQARTAEHAFEQSRLDVHVHDKNGSAISAEPLDTIQRCTLTTKPGLPGVSAGPIPNQETEQESLDTMRLPVEKK